MLLNSKMAVPQLLPLFPNRKASRSALQASCLAAVATLGWWRGSVQQCAATGWWLLFESVLYSLGQKRGGVAQVVRAKVS